MLVSVPINETVYSSIRHNVYINTPSSHLTLFYTFGRHRHQNMADLAHMAAGREVVLLKTPLGHRHELFVYRDWGNYVSADILELDDEKRNLMIKNGRLDRPLSPNQIPRTLWQYSELFQRLRLLLHRQVCFSVYTLLYALRDSGRQKPRISFTWRFFGRSSLP